MFEAVAAQGEVALLEALSVGTYPDGGVVSDDGLFVDAVRDNSGILQTARAVMWVCISLAHMLAPTSTQFTRACSCLSHVLVCVPHLLPGSLP